MAEVVTAASQSAGAGTREAYLGFKVYDPDFLAAIGNAPHLALVAAIFVRPPGGDGRA